jgi:hypothetical protein
MGKRVAPAALAIFLGGVWAVLTAKHIPPPQALNQAIIAAVGAAFAVGAAPKKEDKGEE